MSSVTSSSRPCAARTASSVPSSLSRRMTTVSAAMASRTRPSSSGRRSSSLRWVRAVSVTRWTARIWCAAASSARRAPCSLAARAVRARLRAPEDSAHDADDQRLQREDAETGDDRRAQRGAVGPRSHERLDPDERPHEGGQESGPEPSVPGTEHDRAEKEREIAPVDVGLERVGQEPGDGGGRRGEQVCLGGVPGTARRRPPVGSRGGVYRGTKRSGHWSFPGW